MAEIKTNPIDLDIVKFLPIAISECLSVTIERHRENPTFIINLNQYQKNRVKHGNKKAAAQRTE